MCSTKNLRRFYEPWHLGQWFARRSWFGCLTCTWLEFSVAQGLYHQKLSGVVSWCCWKILKHFQIMLYLKPTKCPVDDPLPATFTARLVWKNPPPESWLWAAWKSWNCKWQQLPQVENTTEWRHFFCHIILVGHYYISLQDFRGTYLEPQFFCILSHLQLSWALLPPILTPFPVLLDRAVEEGRRPWRVPPSEHRSELYQDLVSWDGLFKLNLNSRSSNIL